MFSRSTRAEQERLLAHQETPDDLLYGYLKLSREIFALRSVTRCLDEWTWRRGVRLPLELAMTRQSRMGFALSFARDQLARLRQADVIVSTVDTVGLPVAWLKSRGVLHTPLAYMSQGLTDRLEQMPEHSLRRRYWQMLYRKVLSAVERIVVFGEGAADPMQRLFGVPTQRLAVVPFGVEDAFWLPGAANDSFLLSVGSDRARDYATLVAASETRRLQIVTRLPVPEAAGKDTVTVDSSHSDAQLRALYQRATYVVTPLKDVSQPSGQSATLQAMACGKAVILTRTRGLWEPAVMQHRVNCYLVEPGDVRGLRWAMKWLEANPSERQLIGQAARQTVERHYTSARLADQVAKQIYEALRSN